MLHYSMQIYTNTQRAWSISEAFTWLYFWCVIMYFPPAKIDALEWQSPLWKKFMCCRAAFPLNWKDTVTISISE